MAYAGGRWSSRQSAARVPTISSSGGTKHNGIGSSGNRRTKATDIRTYAASANATAARATNDAGASTTTRANTARTDGLKKIKNMAAIVVYNQKSSQSLRGEAVLVTVDGTDQAQLENLSEGNLVTVGSSLKTGTINRVDTFGTSFSVNPIQPDKTLESAGVYGYLDSGETIHITT